MNSTAGALESSYGSIELSLNLAISLLNLIFTFLIARKSMKSECCGHRACSFGELLPTGNDTAH